MSEQASDPNEPVSDEPRWLYRFDSFSRALTLLREGVALSSTRDFSMLEKEGLVRRFEYTSELAWKTLKDMLTHQGVAMPTVAPRAVVRAGFEAGLINDGDVWLAAIEARNAMSHTYDAEAFERIVDDIKTRYFPLYEKLHATGAAWQERGDA